MDLKQASEMIQRDPQLVNKIARSPEGQRLMALLENGQNLQSNIEKAGQGDAKAMAGLLKQVMADPEGKALLTQLSREL